MANRMSQDHSTTKKVYPHPGGTAQGPFFTVRVHEIFILIFSSICALFPNLLWLIFRFYLVIIAPPMVYYNIS